MNDILILTVTESILNGLQALLKTLWLWLPVQLPFFEAKITLEIKGYTIAASLRDGAGHNTLLHAKLLFKGCKTTLNILLKKGLRQHATLHLQNKTLKECATSGGGKSVHRLYARRRMFVP